MQLSISANPPVPIDRSGPGQEPLTSKTSGRFSVAPWPAATSFFASMSPNYMAKSPASSFSHAQPPSATGKQPSLPGAVQGIGLASKVISCWLPQVGLAGEIISNACSSFSLAHQLGTASRKSDSSANPAGEKQTPPGHGQVLSNSFFGAGAAALGLIAMDSLAGAAAEELQTTPRPDGLPVDPSLTGLDSDGSGNQTGTGEGAHSLSGDELYEISGDPVDELSGDAVDELSGGSGGSGGSGTPVVENELHIHSLAASSTAQAPAEMSSTLPEGGLPDQAPPSTDTPVITPSQTMEHTASRTVNVPVESPTRGATQHPGNSSSALMASAAMAADTTQSSSAATTSVLSGAVGDNFGRNLHHEIRFSSPTLASDSTMGVHHSPTLTSSVASPAPQPGTGDTMAMANSTTLESTVANSTMAFADPVISSAVAADTTQSSGAATTSVLSGAVGDNFGRNLHHEIHFSSPTLASNSTVGAHHSSTLTSSVASPAPQPGTGDTMAMANSTTLETTVANSTMAVADPVMLVDSTTAALSSYSPASSSPVGTVFSTEAPPSPTPPPPLAEPLLPGSLMALNNTQAPPPPPVGLAVLSHNSSHVALNGTSSAPMTQMSMVSPTSVLPVLPTSAVPAASAALSLAGGLGPLTLISLSVGVSAFMFGIGALHGRYADDKKEQ